MKVAAHAEKAVVHWMRRRRKRKKNKKKRIFFAEAAQMDEAWQIREKPYFFQKEKRSHFLRHANHTNNGILMVY